MSSRFVENLTDIPISHPHLNVSLSDILAEESRKRSISSSSSTSSSASTSSPISSPTSSPTLSSPSPMYLRPALYSPASKPLTWSSAPAHLDASPSASPASTSPRPTSPGSLSRMNATRRRGFTLASRKERSAS